MPARLYLVTGKGGVGKTSIALALAHYLKNQNVKVCYTNMEFGTEEALVHELELDSFFLDIKDSAQLYMAKKLNSETIAKWISKTPFFESIFNMVPGFSDLIFLGHLIYKLEADPELTIVLDSPATGHALGLLESPQNFKDIFGAGAIVRDIEELYKAMSAPNFLHMVIASLPNIMSFQEAIELQAAVKKSSAKIQANFILNEVFSQDPALIKPKEKLPAYLQEKLAIEKEVIGEFNHIQAKDVILLPYIASESNKQVITSLSPHMERLI